MLRVMKVDSSVVFLMTFALLTGAVVGEDMERKTRLAQSSWPNCVTNTYPYSLSVAKTRFTQHEPILLKFAITNTYDRPLNLSLGYDREGGFIFTVRRPDRSIVEIPSKRTKAGLARIGKFTIQPRQTYTQQLVLNEWFAFSDPGTYEITAKLKNPPQTNEEVSEPSQTTRIAIEVVPLDVPQLQHACSELGEVISRNVSDYAKASEAARALIAVRHPIAVPFLEKALEANKGVASFVIAGLEEVGNDQAVRVLISVLEHSDLDSSEFAQSRAALVNLKKNTADPATLQSIKIALAKSAP